MPRKVIFEQYANNGSKVPSTDTSATPREVGLSLELTISVFIVTGGQFLLSVFYVA